MMIIKVALDYFQSIDLKTAYEREIYFITAKWQHNLATCLLNKKTIQNNTVIIYLQNYSKPSWTNDHRIT